MEAELNLKYYTIAKYRAIDPDCTGDFEDSNGDIMPETARITVNCDAAGKGVEWCPAEYDGSQSFESLY